MAEYVVVNNDTNEVVDLVILDDPSEFTSDTQSVVLYEPENEYCRIGEEYIGGDYGLFQPKVAEESDWTKNADGVWTAILTRTDPKTVWDSDSGSWVTVNELRVSLGLDPLPEPHIV